MTSRAPKIHVLKDGVCSHCGPGTVLFLSNGRPYCKTRDKPKVRRQYTKEERQNWPSASKVYPSQDHAVKYGIAKERRKKKLAEEIGYAFSGMCDICNTKIEEPHHDHNHGTGRYRGYLCRLCNVGLGHFGDNPDRLRAAAKYLDDRTS